MYVETGFYIAPAGLDLTTHLRMTLNFWFSSIPLPSTEIPDIHMPGSTIGPGIKIWVVCPLGKYSYLLSYSLALKVIFHIKYTEVSHCSPGQGNHILRSMTFNYILTIGIKTILTKTFVKMKGGSLSWKNYPLFICLFGFIVCFLSLMFFVVWEFYTCICFEQIHAIHLTLLSLPLSTYKVALAT